MDFLNRIIKKNDKIKDFILRNLKDIKIKKENHLLSHLEKILFYISAIEKKDDFFYINFIWDDEVVFYKDINKEGVLCNLTNAVFSCVKKEDIFSFSNTYSNIIDYIKTGDKFYFLNFLLENKFNLNIVCYFFDKINVEKNKDISILNDYFVNEIQNIFSNNEKDINFIGLEYFFNGALFNKREQLAMYIDLFFRNNYLTCERCSDFKERIFQQDIKLFEKVLSHYKKIFTVYRHSHKRTKKNYFKNDFDVFKRIF